MLALYTQHDRPFVAFKPSTSAFVGDDIYQPVKPLFSPNRSSVQTLVTALNQLDINAQFGDPRVDRVRCHWLDSDPIENQQNLSFAIAEEMARRTGTNVLGGVFLEFIRQFGYQHQGRVMQSEIQADDKEFYQTFYPDITDFIINPTTLSTDRRQFAASIVYNNAGMFKYVAVTKPMDMRLPDSLDLLVYLKKIYRVCVHRTVTMDPSEDNLVHSPENIPDLVAQLRILNSRQVA